MVLDAPLLSRLSHKRLMATFQVEAQRGEQDLYRCITLSPRGAAISNFGELIVRGELDFETYDKCSLICESHQLAYSSHHLHFWQLWQPLNNCGVYTHVSTISTVLKHVEPENIVVQTAFTLETLTDYKQPSVREATLKAQFCKLPSTPHWQLNYSKATLWRTLICLTKEKVI